jgi:hypothetical protein
MTTNSDGAFRLPVEERLMLPLPERFHRSLAKSKGALSLYDHVADSTRVAVHILEHSMPTGYPIERRDTSVLATFLHDVGKLDQDFQQMLYCRWAGDEEGVKGLKRVKHEASTLDDEPRSLVERDLEQAIAAVAQVTGYQARPERVNLMDLWAFAVSHHGLFYLSLERWPRSPEPIPLVRRQWTTFYPREESRVTLTDLLLEYHPLGGLVIVSDLAASYCHGSDRALDEVLHEYERIEEFIEGVLLPRAGEIEGYYRTDDPRDFGLEATLKLLLGGIRYEQ